MKKAKRKNRRKNDSQNHAPVNLAEAVLIAAEQVGEDGKGKNGIGGFLRWAAEKHPSAKKAGLPACRR